MKFTPNRIAVYLTVVAGIAGAVAPAVADLDTTSTAGVVAGLFTILVAAVKWLEGWQKFEAANMQAELMHLQVTLGEEAARREAEQIASSAKAAPTVRLPR